MNYSQNSSSTGFSMTSTPMVVSAVLFGAGAMLGIAGLILGSTTMMSAARQWFRGLDVPPSEAMRHKWGQTKAATMAGAQAWQAADGIQMPSSSRG
jgi:hypothetical protein